MHGRPVTITVEEVAARAAVMEIPLYPDLPVLLKKTLSYGPHVDVLQHLIYWFHPRKPSMRNRWALYKSFHEWRVECGLSDRQLKKGRKKLQELGLLTLTLGQSGKVWYEVDWRVLADLLDLVNPDTIGVQVDDSDDDFEEFNLDAVVSEFDPAGKASGLNPAGKASRSIRPVKRPASIQETSQETTAEDYLQESPLLQEAGCQKADIPGRVINKDFEDLEEHLSSQTSDDKRRPQDSATPPEKTAAREEVDEPPIIEETPPPAPPEPEDAQLLADLREVLDPDTGRWDRSLVEYVRSKYGSCQAYSPEGLARNLSLDPALPYNDRQADLVPCLRRIFWEWSNEREAAMA